MVLAVGVGRTGLGLGLIRCFSVGLVLVLTGLGPVLVRFRAVIVTVLGIGWS